MSTPKLLVASLVYRIPLGYLMADGYILGENILHQKSL